jgi:HlyD family type I secretion membrane fusion protein
MNGKNEQSAWRKFFVKRDDRLALEFQSHSLAIQDTPPSPFTRTILWSLVILIGIVIIWSYFSRVPIMTSSPGKFSSVGSTKVIQSLNTGTVSHILVKAGEKVYAGQPLVELNNTVNYSALVSRNSMLQLNNLENKRILSEIQGRTETAESDGFDGASPLALLESQLALADMNNARSEIAYDRSKVAESRARLEAGVATLDEYKDRASADNNVVVQATPLVHVGAISEYHYHQLRDDALRSAGKLATQENQVAELTQAITTVQDKLAEDQDHINKQLFKQWQHSQLEVYDLKRKQVTARHQYQLDWLRSPVNGVVQNLDVASLGAVIQAGQTVATIVPDGAPLIVVADVPTQDAGFIHAGQKVDIKVAAFPFEQYGMIQGLVMSVSPTADSMETVAAPPPGENHQAPQGGGHSGQGHSHAQGSNSGPPTLYYQVRVQPDQLWLKIAGKKHFMEPGMTATIDIRTGDRSVLEFFLAPISKYINNGFSIQ